MENVETIEKDEQSIDMAHIAAAVRAIRRQKGLTLREVEELSEGKWKSVVIGSYERCDRTLSLKKAIALAGFYKVPLDQLLGLDRTKSSTSDRIVLDIRKITANYEKSRFYAGLENFLKSICQKRRDWNGEVLSIRTQDIFTLALLQGVDENFVIPWLGEKKFLFN